MIRSGKTAIVVATAVAAALSVEVASRAVMSWLDVGRFVIDIQTPAVLCSKLAAIKRFDGVKVLLIGDSVVYGRTMSEHGDARWREHQLGAVLERRLKLLMPDQPVSVFNLGMNGSLPFDQEQLVRLAMGLGLDLIVSDVTLRSFSRDFATAEAHFSRPWLAALRLDEAGCTQDRNGGLADILNGSISNFLLSFSAAYAMRDYFQWGLLEGPPRSLLSSWQIRLQRSLARPIDATDQRMMLSLNAQRRYQLIQLNALRNPQYAAFVRMLRQMAVAARHAVLFYAPEDPSVLPQLLERRRYEASREYLRRHVAAAGVERLLYIEDIRGLEGRYLDYVHVDAAGYELMADRIMSGIASVLRPR